MSLRTPIVTSTHFRFSFSHLRTSHSSFLKAVPFSPHRRGLPPLVPHKWHLLRSPLSHYTSSVHLVPKYWRHLHLWKLWTNGFATSAGAVTTLEAMSLWIKCLLFYIHFYCTKVHLIPTFTNCWIQRLVSSMHHDLNWHCSQKEGQMARPKHMNMKSEISWSYFSNSKISA